MSSIEVVLKVWSAHPQMSPRLGQVDRENVVACCSTRTLEEAAFLPNGFNMHEMRLSGAVV